MPELPEVETVRRVLEPQLKGLTVDRVVVYRPEVVAHPEVEQFCARLCGQTVRRMERRGKFLTIVMESGDRIVLHLRMTGGLMLTPADFPPEKHTHLVMQMKNGAELRFFDQRRFGRFWLVAAGEETVCTGLQKLGIEPFDNALSAQYMKSRLGNRTKAIKECLLEQGVIAGIGNIYSDEILFAAKIHPARPANSLTAEEWEQLTETIPERLSYFIEKNAISAEDYLQTKGKDYRNTPFLQVYGHSGEACPLCRQTLCRTVIGGRSSVWCPHCQR